LGDGWPVGYTLTFHKSFYADCAESGVATFKITADNVFTAYLNGALVGTGNNWTNVYSFNVNLLCGHDNNLTIVVINYDEGSPAALIYSIYQYQDSCYTCKNEVATYYNQNTCSCQCVDHCACTAGFVWNPYPYCTCGCPRGVKCTAPHYFNKETCSCQC